MAKKVLKKAVKEVVKEVKPVVKKDTSLADLEKKVEKLEAYIKQQVNIKQLGGDTFSSYPEL